MHTYDYTNRTNAILIDLQKKNQYHIRFYITWIRGIQGTTENLKKKKKNLINDSLLSKYVEQSKYEGTEE